MAQSSSLLSLVIFLLFYLCVHYFLAFYLLLPLHDNKMSKTREIGKRKRNVSRQDQKKIENRTKSSNTPVSFFSSWLQLETERERKKTHLTFFHFDVSNDAVKCITFPMKMEKRRDDRRASNWVLFHKRSFSSRIVSMKDGNVNFLVKNFCLL